MDYYERRRCEGNQEDPFWNDIVKFIVAITIVALMLVFSSCRTIRSHEQQHKTSVSADTLTEKLFVHSGDKELRDEKQDTYHGKSVIEWVLKHDSMAIHTDSNGMQSFHYYHNTTQIKNVHDTVTKNVELHDTLWKDRIIYKYKEHASKDSIDNEHNEIKVVKNSWWDEIKNIGLVIMLISMLIFSIKYTGLLKK